MKYSIFNFKSMAKGLVRQHTAAIFSTMLIFGTLSFAFYLLENVFATAPEQTLTITLSSLAVALLTTILLGPASVGVASVFCDIAGGRAPKVSNIFLWYGEGKKLKKSVGLAVLQGLILLGLTVIFGAIVLGGAYLISPSLFSGAPVADYNGAMQLVVSLYAVIVLILALVYAVYSLFIPATYILAENPDEKVLNCLKRSRQMMKSIIFKFIGLLATFVLQFLGYTIIIAIVVTMLMGDQVMATTVSTMLAALVLLFHLAPQFHLTVILLTHDLQVQNKKED